MRKVFFSSGPSKKFKEWHQDLFLDDLKERSHTDLNIKNRIKNILIKIKEVLCLPSDYKVIFTSGSGSGAMASAFLNLLNKKIPCDILISDYFSKEWAKDLKDMNLDLNCYDIWNNYEFAEPNLRGDSDKILVQVETTLGIKIPNFNFLNNNKGITIVDAISAAFLEEMPWKIFDATAVSLQKVLGVDTAMGILILSPKAVERIDDKKDWPIPRCLNIKRWGLCELENGRVMSSPSMYSLIELEAVLDWVIKNGGVSFLRKKSIENHDVLNDELKMWGNVKKIIPEKSQALAAVCLEPKFFDKKNLNEEERKKFIKKISDLACENGIYDIINFARPCFRIWLGPMQEAEDVAYGVHKICKLIAQNS